MSSPVLPLDDRRPGPAGNDRPPIGGFFELDLGVHPGNWQAASVSIKSLWFDGELSVLAFRTGRSAFRHLLANLPARTAFLPSYLCRAMAMVAQDSGWQVRFYELNEDLSPALGGLAMAEVGDLVLAVDYFGRPPNAAFRRFAEARPDIVWVEDRAQALLPAAEPWGAFVLYSPRKLCGVPDGGYLVARSKVIRPPDLAPPAFPVPLLAPALLRFEDPAGCDNDRWYAAYRAAEDAMPTAAVAPTRLTGELLGRLDAVAFATRRRENYAALAGLLPGRSLWGGSTPDWVPQFFPLATERAGAIASELARQRIFCPRLWPELAQAASAQARHLAAHLLFLPCDHRYSPSDMVSVAAAFAGASKGA